MFNNSNHYFTRYWFFLNVKWLFASLGVVIVKFVCQRSICYNVFICIYINNLYIQSILLYVGMSIIIGTYLYWFIKSY